MFKADYLEERLAKGANEVGIADLVAWLREAGKPELVKYVENHTSRRHIEKVIANIRDWVRAGQIDRAEQEAKRYDVNADYIGELLRRRIEHINAKPLEVGRQIIAGLTERRDQFNAARHRIAEADATAWQREAEKIWKDGPNLPKAEVARRVKKRLNATQKAATIAKKLRTAS